MPQLISPAVKVIAKEGQCEIHVTLDLNINLNTQGVSIAAKQEAVKTEEEETNWVIPTFKTGDKVKFGNKE